MDSICVSAQSEALVKLQAHKSAFQAWKCVSLVYALVVLVLVGSKRHEVGYDIQQLNGVARLILSQQQETRHTYRQLDNDTVDDMPLSSPVATVIKREGTGEGDRNQAPEHNLSLGSLLDALESALTPNNTQSLNTSMLIPVPTTASTGGQVSKMAAEDKNSSLLMSHMQTSIGRELNGQEVLKAEIDAFADEFKTAKSTLNLSSLLVLVYILSWILMALAVNDARISDDVTLRNTLLLSVFGAIDLAASVGFVVIRLTMYSMKNSPFAASVISSTVATSSLEDSSTQLSSDQLASFTALRLIAMRSCAAYIDIYVSTLIAVLTGLRLYSIIRALTYYRRLKRFNDRFGLFHRPLVNRWPASINWTQPSSGAPVVQHNPSGSGGGAMSEISGRHNHHPIVSSGYHTRQSHYNQFNHQPMHMTDYAFGHNNHLATGAKSTLWPSNGQPSNHNDKPLSGSQVISSNNMISQNSTGNNTNYYNNNHDNSKESEFDAATLMHHMNQSNDRIDDGGQSDRVSAATNTYRGMKGRISPSRQQTKLDLVQETSLIPDVLIVDSRQVAHKLVADRGDERLDRVRQTVTDIEEMARRKKLRADELINRHYAATVKTLLSGSRRAQDHQRYAKRQQVSIDTGFESEPTANSGEGTLNGKGTIKGSIVSGRSQHHHHPNRRNQLNEDTSRDHKSSLVLLPPPPPSTSASSSMSVSSSGEAKLIVQRPTANSTTTGAAVKDNGAFAILSASHLEKLAQRIVAKETKRELKRAAVDESQANSFAGGSQRARLTTKSNKLVAGRNKSTTTASGRQKHSSSNKHSASQRRDCDTDTESETETDSQSDESDADADGAVRRMVMTGYDEAGGRNSVEVYSCSSGELRQTEEFAVRAPTQPTANNKLSNNNKQRRSIATGNYSGSLSSRKRAAGQIEHATTIAADHNSNSNSDNTLARLLLGKYYYS